MDIATAIGGFAAILSTASFTPQAWKIIQTRDTSSISAGMYGMTVAGFLAWTVYGVLLAAWPVIAANAICLLLSGFILMMKILPQREKEKVAEKITDITPQG